MQDPPEVAEAPSPSSNGDGTPRRVNRRAGRPVIHSSDSSTDNLGSQDGNANPAGRESAGQEVHKSDSDDNVAPAPTARPRHTGRRAARHVVHESDSEADAEDVALPHGSERRPVPQRKGHSQRRVVDESDSEVEAKDVAQPHEQSQQPAEQSIPHVGDGESAEHDCINCPCGDDDEYGDMIQCDSCSTYQHLVCVGITLEQAVEMHYLCPNCDPEAFEALKIKQASPSTEVETPITPQRRRLRKGLKQHPGSDEPEQETVRTPRSMPTARKAKRTTSARSEEATNAIEATATLPPALQPLDEVIAENARVSRNVFRWNQAIGPDGHGIRLLKVVLPTKIKGRVDFMRDLLRGPVVDNRQLSLESCIIPHWGQKNFWHFMVKDNNAPNGQIFKVRGSFYNTNTLPDKKSAFAVGEKLCRYLERLPAPLATAKATGRSKPSAMSALLQVVVFADVFRGTDWIPSLIKDLKDWPAGFHVMHMQITSGKYRCTSDVPVIADKTEDGSFDLHNLVVHVSIDKLDMSVAVPPIDTDLAALFPAINIDKAYLLSKKIPSEKHDQCLRAAEIVQYVKTKMYAAVGSWQDIQKLQDAIVRPFLLETHRTTKEGLEKNKMVGPYNNNKLMYFEPQPAYKEFTLWPSNWLAKDVEGDLPGIRIKSSSRTRISFVIEKLMARYYATGDILQSWRSACECADRVSAALISSEDIKLQYCQCPEEERNTTVHICQLCLEAELCRDLSRSDSGCLVCQKCTASASITDDFSMKPGERLRFRLTVTIHNDKSIAINDRKKIIEQIWEHLQQFRMSGDLWQDHWADTLREEYIESGRVMRQHPLAISFDAMQPLSVVGNKVLYHANPSNICLTAVFLNRLKGLYFPVLLGYMRIAEEMRTAPVDQDYDKLIDQLDHLYVKTCKYKFSDKNHRGNIDVKRARAIISELKHPVASQQEANLVFVKTSQSDGYHMNATWSEADRAMINQIISQCEVRFSRTVQRGRDDGAPWLWIPFHMPPDWSWYRLWQEIARRLQRMRLFCNAKWETIDNTLTLLLECVYQHLKNDGRDEFLGLPMTIFKKHPLIYSIGHRHHGSQMRTGFTTLYPQNLDQDFDESLSNILLEAYLSNFVKWDHLETQYDLIRDGLRSVHLKTQYYGVPNDCPRFDFDEVFASGTSTAASEDADVEESDESDNEWTAD